jgi:arylsulfatase A-like enzyme
VRSQYAHIIDLVPTVLEAIGLETPQTLRGIPQAPLDGVSFAHTFSQAEAPSRRPTQYFELNGHRAIYHEGWRAVCPWIESNQTGARPENYDCNVSVASVVQEDIAAHRWELYRIAEDYAECHDLAAEDPATLRKWSLTGGRKPGSTTFCLRLGRGNGQSLTRDHRSLTSDPRAGLKPTGRLCTTRMGHRFP